MHSEPHDWSRFCPRDSQACGAVACFQRTPLFFSRFAFTQNVHWGRSSFRGREGGKQSQRAAFAWIKDAADTPTFFLGHNRHSARRGQIVIRVDEPFTQMHIKACGPAHQRRSARMLIRIHGRLRKLWENALKSQLAESLADYPVDILSIKFFWGGKGNTNCANTLLLYTGWTKTHCFAWKSCYQEPMPSNIVTLGI